jgi:hypothetical protein
MTKWMLRAGLAVLVILIGVQFIPIGRTPPPVESDIPTSPEVKAVLRRACYDGHSNEPEWPWYSRIAPFSWVVANHVREGRAELNFSTWDQYNTQQQVKKPKESWVNVTEGGNAALVLSPDSSGGTPVTR